MTPIMEMSSYITIDNDRGYYRIEIREVYDSDSHFEHASNVDMQWHSLDYVAGRSGGG